MTEVDRHLFVIFGGMGDLARRKLIPSLQRLIGENDLVSWTPAKRTGQMAGFGRVENHSTAVLQSTGYREQPRHCFHGTVAATAIRLAQSPRTRYDGMAKPASISAPDT